jgi:hypothetical protein
MEDSTGDPWGDEGFGGGDDWEGKESLETSLEDEDDDELEPSLEVDDDELDGDGDAELEEAL